MIVIKFLGKDDYIAGLRHGDIFVAKIGYDVTFYLVESKYGEEICIGKHEAIELNG